MSESSGRVTARIGDDMQILSGKFDCTSWFEQATDDQLEELEGESFRNSYAADAVAEFCEAYDTEHETRHAEVACEVIAMCSLINQSNHCILRAGGCGYSVVIDLDEANAWIFHNRPQLAAELGITEDML